MATRATRRGRRILPPDPARDLAAVAIVERGRERETERSERILLNAVNEGSFAAVRINLSD